MADLILNSLEIRNFRAFHDLRIGHLGRVNLLVGKNNVGKTSLLEAIWLYANRASTPTFIWDIMSLRGEVKQPFVNVRDMLAALKYLYHGRKDIRPGLVLRALGISLALVNVKDGILLIDEFENGLYYTVQPDIWKLIFRVARRLNIQVFATTHSWDCIEAFQQAAQEDGNDEDALLIRLESKLSDIAATLYDKKTLGIAARDHIEVR